MKVESQAGKFILDFQQMEPGDGEIIISGKMGVWDAKTHMTLREFVKALSQVRLVHGTEVCYLLQEDVKVLLNRTRRYILPQLGIEDQKPDRVLLLEHEIGKRCCKIGTVFQLCYSV